MDVATILAYCCPRDCRPYDWDRAAVNWEEVQTFLRNEFGR